MNVFFPRSLLPFFLAAIILFNPSPSFSQTVKVNTDSTTKTGNILQAEELMKQGVALGREKYFKKSIEKIAMAIELVPDNPELWYNLGLSYFNLSDYESAEKAWKKSIAFKSDHLDAHFNLGLIYSRQKKDLEAINAFAQCIQLNQDENAARSNLIKHCLKFAESNLQILQMKDPAKAQIFKNELSGLSNPQNVKGKHPLADQQIPGIGKNFQQLLEIFQKIPFQNRK